MPVRDWRTISTWLKIALICLPIGVLLFVIGFATKSWMVGGVTDIRGRYAIIAKGLWKEQWCYERARSCTSYSYGTLSRLEDYHRATQAMECIGLIGVVLALLLLLLYVFIDSCRRREAMLATIVFIFVAVVCMVIGFAVFGSHYEHVLDVGWSMGVAIAGSVFCFIAGVMCVLQIAAR